MKFGGFINDANGGKPRWPTPAVPACLGLLIFALIGAVLYPRTESVAQSPPTMAPAAPKPLAPLTTDATLKPKDIFKDCNDCPEMVVVPAGRFNMGSPTGEPGRDVDESPQHGVTIAKPFAVSRFAVTFDEFDACVAGGGCEDRKPGDQGWGRGRRPALNVSWDDAAAYLEWLSRKAGKPYRLLTEAEYEYAARAGSTTAYYWGDAIGKGNANCDGCGSQWDNIQTAPVGSFAANAFGLHDMAGNAWQWLQDCYHENYNGAPADDAAWTGADCGRRVIRGGSWISVPEVLRSAGRFWNTANSRGNLLGFRVARTLTP
jgi:formylglycine-generating enzyme required for sulfatase activity